MSYYDSIDQDLARAKQILDTGKPNPDDYNDFDVLPSALQESILRAGGTIIGADTSAAYHLLKSFVAEIERLNERVKVLEALREKVQTLSDQALKEIDTLRRKGIIP